MKKSIFSYIIVLALISGGVSIFCISMAQAGNDLSNTHINYNESEKELPFKKFAIGISGGYSYPYGKFKSLKSGYDWGAKFIYYVTAHSGIKIGWERLGISYNEGNYGVDTPPWDSRFVVILYEKNITPYRINIAYQYFHGIGNSANPKVFTHFDIGFGHYRMNISSRQSIRDDSTGVIYNNNHDFSKSRIAFEMGGGLFLRIAKDVALDFDLMLSYNVSGRTEDMILTAPVGQASSLYYSSGIPKFDGIMSTKLGLIWFF